MTLAGWMVTEVGRQPWVIYGWMRTSEAASALLPQQVSHYFIDTLYSLQYCI